MADVPRVDEDGSADQDGIRQYERIQLRSLDADVTARENLNREADQRYAFRTWTVILSSFLVLLILAIFFHIVVNLDELIEERVPTLIVIALFVAPIAAMVALSVSLLLAAFRGSKDGDGQTVTDAAIDGAKATGMIG